MKLPPRFVAGHKGMAGLARVRKLVFMAVPMGLFSVCLLGAIGGAEVLLRVNQEPRRADAIVVLGGGAKTRAAKAIELFRQGYAEKILVAGKNEEALIGKQLREAGIPDSALLFEPESRSTYENAVFSLPYLRRWQVNSILLVTSWFHSRRAVAVFRSAEGMPDVVSVPTEVVSIKQLLTEKRLLVQVLKEYLKIAGYWFRYGLSPLLSGEQRYVCPEIEPG